jgi:hypothetical protein
MTKPLLKPIEVGPEGQFSLGGESFVVDMSRGPHRRPSDSEGFTTVKNEPYFQIYQLLAAEFSPRSILELGIRMRKLRASGQIISTPANVCRGTQSAASVGRFPG